jgi:hypothetical protein
MRRVAYVDSFMEMLSRAVYIKETRSRRRSGGAPDENRETKKHVKKSQNENKKTFHD